MTVILPDTSRWSGGFEKDSDKDKTSGRYFNPWGWTGKLTTRYKSSLGYSSSTLYDSTRSSYQSYSFSYTNPEDREQVKKLLTSAYKSVREVIVILDFPFPVEVCFSSRSFFNKKGGNTRCIFLSTKYLDNKTETDSDKIDVICGSGVHEAAHLRYSEVRVINSFIESIKRTESWSSITTIIVNLLEDERVEDKLLKERPGFVEYISKKKTWEFKNSPISKKKSFDDNTEVFFMIVRFLRYKDTIIEGDIPEKYQKLFLEIGNLVAPIYNDSSLGIKGVCNIGKDVSSLIVSYLSLTPSDINKISKVTYYQEICSGFDMENPKITSSYGSSFSLLSEETSLVDNFWLRTIEEIAKGSMELINKNCMFHKAVIKKDDPYYYEETKKRISKYIPSVRRQLVSQAKNYEYIVHGCRTGLLDTTKLVEAYQGVPHVYKRLGHVVTSNLSICILIDESGSMAGYDKISVARETAILLNEALSGVPGVNLFIYGHSADYLTLLPEETRESCFGMVDITIYKEPGMSKSSSVGLNRISAKYENRDGDAILQVAKRVRKYTDDHCLMFVISDGEPLARSYSGRSAREHTHKQIVTVETTLDTTVFGICIDTISNAGDIYPRYISLEHDLSNFAKNLGKIIKTEVLKTRVTTIT